MTTILTAKHIKLMIEDDRIKREKEAIKFIEDHWGPLYNYINMKLANSLGADFNLKDELDPLIDGSGLKGRDGKVDSTKLGDLYRDLGFDVNFSRSSNYYNERIFIRVSE